MRRSEHPRARSAFGAALPSALRVFAFWTAALVLLELTLHIKVFGGLSARLLYGLLFDLSAAAGLALLSRILPGRAGRVLSFVFLALLYLIFAVQTVYFEVFDTLLSLSFVTMGGEAVGAFLPIVLQAIGHCAPQLLLSALPFPLLALAQRRRPLGRRTAAELLLLLAASAGLFLLAMVPVWHTGGETPPGSVYRDVHSTVDRQTEYFGLLTAERLEIGRLLHGGTHLTDVTVDLAQPEGPSEETQPRNILPELDFSHLAASTDDENLQELSRYFSGLSGTLQNDYTGVFEGFNLIEICAEAFSPYLLDEELTPTLYQLAHQGFVFENFYNSFPSVTTNGEYSMCMGLLPDMSRISFATAMDNHLPFCLGNAFRSQGFAAYAYHNNEATYYNRINTHSNMGYDFKAVNFGLDMEAGFPSSDLEMMEKSVDDYLGQAPFVAYYMTYSGHAYYNFTDNEMAIKNQDRVAHLTCSEELKAYYACQLELEDAVAYLLERLEAAGLADRTVIVLSGDHYPYGLSDEAMAELAGDAADSDPFWKFRSSFLCWSGAMKEPVTVDSFCCTQDILPTLLNLFGLPYDSRLLTGMDVLSPGTHLAVLYDGSFLSEDLCYDANDGQIIWRSPEEVHPAGYAQELIAAVRNQFSVSAAILRSDYYRFAFDASGLATEETPHVHYAAFQDIVGTWYEQDVETLVARGAITGGDGGFRGGDDATRADFAAMLARTLFLEAQGGQPPPFSDVRQGRDWFYGPVAALWQAGILPEGDGTFRGHDAITPEEARQLLTAAASRLGMDDAEAWSTEAAQAVLERAAQAGEDPDRITRGAAAALIAPLAAQAAD